MRQSKIWFPGLALLLCLFTPTLRAADLCEAEAKWTNADAQRHFMVLAGRSEVFYERSGPTYVMLIKASGDESAKESAKELAKEFEIGAFGIYANAAGQPVFGAVPASEYEAFLREPDKASSVMLRVEINGAQYERAAKVMHTWDRRVRERALLYPDVALDNILLVKQATEELNRCSPTLVSYALDWGLADDISEHNAPLRIPFEYFKELRRRNAAKHVPDSAMPAALLQPVAAVQWTSRRN